jgi:holo-[acyl-carrier protein] synthase
LSLHNPGAGVDLVSVDEVAQSIDRFGDGYLNRVYTETERRETKERADRLAERFAAKEAVFKALGGADQPFVWTDIEVTNPAGTAPGVRLHGAAAHRADSNAIVGWAVTITHDRRTAAAMVVARTADRTGD